MRPIQMVDTKTQYHKIKPAVDQAVTVEPVLVTESVALVARRSVAEQGASQPARQPATQLRGGGRHGLALDAAPAGQPRIAGQAGGELRRVARAREAGNERGAGTSQQRMQEMPAIHGAHRIRMLMRAPAAGRSNAASSNVGLRITCGLLLKP